MLVRIQPLQPNYMQLNLITSWDAITIEKYFTYQQHLTNENTSDFEKQINILSLLLGIDKATMDELPASQVVPLFDKMEFLTKQPYAEPRTYYDIGGNKYFLQRDVMKITAGQFIDLTHYTKDPSGILENIHNICAVLLLPVKPYRGKQIPPVEKYGESDVIERAEFLYNHMSIGEAMGISGFFTMLYSLFIEITKRYLETEKTKQLNLASKMLSRATLQQLETGSKKNGSGLQQ